MAQVSINLLTREFRNTGNTVIESSIKWISLLAVVSILGTGAWQFTESYVANSELQSSKTELASLQKKLTEVQKIKSLDDNVKQALNLTKTTKSKSMNYTQMLNLVQSKTPGGITLKTQSIKADGISLQFEAGSIPDIEVYADSLKAEKTFTSVEIQSISSDGKTLRGSIQISLGNGGQKK